MNISFIHSCILYQVSSWSQSWHSHQVADAEPVFPEWHAWQCLGETSRVDTVNGRDGILCMTAREGPGIPHYCPLWIPILELHTVFEGSISPLAFSKWGNNGQKCTWNRIKYFVFPCILGPTQCALVVWVSWCIPIFSPAISAVWEWQSAHTGDNDFLRGWYLPIVIYISSFTQYPFFSYG